MLAACSPLPTSMRNIGPSRHPPRRTNDGRRRRDSNDGERRGEEAERRGRALSSGAGRPRDRSAGRARQAGTRARRSAATLLVVTLLALTQQKCEQRSCSSAEGWRKRSRTWRGSCRRKGCHRPTRTKSSYKGLLDSCLLPRTLFCAMQHAACVNKRNRLYDDNAELEQYNAILRLVLVVCS